MMAASEIVKKAQDGSIDINDMTEDITVIVSTLQDNFHAMYEKSQTILIRTCYAADVVCAVRIMLDLTVKYREAKAELMKSDSIAFSDACSELNDYLAANKGAADVELLTSMMKDMDCLAEHFMGYKEIVVKLDEQWKGEKSFLAVSSESGMTTEATRKALMKNQIIIKGYLDLAKKTLKPVSYIPAPPGEYHNGYEILVLFCCFPGVVPRPGCGGDIHTVPL
ncbi:hypothetical protein NP493_401g03027 [Ridgeia piscesae]|uniref:Uncharacterized protein n=1 Tax=Ridgeia piscesae TaxID=27915 RepID=A0AAD9L2I7_RIDPI|nr:hypothetical protein NP493_401g03027 [Ridgeia piscesae]